MIGFNYSVRELHGSRFGPIIGSYVAASDRPPDEGSLIEVGGKLRRVIAAGRESDLDELNNTILVAHYTDPAQPSELLLAPRILIRGRSVGREQTWDFPADEY